LRFSDVILAVATLSVISIVVIAVISYGLLYGSVSSLLALNLSAIISILVAGFLTGNIFALEIQEESRIKSAGKIAVLGGFIELFALLISFPGNAYYGAYTKDTLTSMFSNTASWTNADWFVHESTLTFLYVSLNVVLVIALGFISIYAGSMLRKPKKT